MKLYKVTRTWYTKSTSCVQAIEDSKEIPHDEVKSSWVKKQSKKVKIIADESLDAIYPDNYRPTTFEIILKNGKSYTKTVQNPYGDPRNTLDDDALYKKFVKWSGPSLTEDEALAIKDIVWRLEKLDNLNELMELIRS